MTHDHEVVSFDSEQLIVVNQADDEIGHLSKAACHEGDGVLHRAFSLFIFNEAGELLIQQRSAQKQLWPLFWANSCCSHPRHGETMEKAIHRRLYEELRMTSDLAYLYKFIYQAHFGKLAAEYEYCWVYMGKSIDPVTPNHNEIAAWRFVAPEELDTELAREPEKFTPWFKLEWQRIRHDFFDQLNELRAPH